MALKNIIVDPETGEQANVILTSNGKRSLVTASQELRTFQNTTRFFTNPTYGKDANKNAGAGGTPIVVHDGTDSVAWTGSIISGTTIVFNSTAQAHSGTKSVLCPAVVVNSEWQFAKGSAQDLTGYTGVTLWIYLSQAWAAGDGYNLYGWDTGTGTIRGTAIDMNDYVNPNTTGAWQKITVPFADMGLTALTIDAFRMNYTPKSGAPKTFYIDDFQIEEATSTGTAIFSLEPAQEETILVKGVNIIMADAYAGTVSDGTMPSLPYDTFLGVSALDTGIGFRVTLGGQTIFQENYKQFSDMLSFPTVKQIHSGSDGTNTWFLLNIEFAEWVELHQNDGDKLEMIINDDLTGLLLFQVSADCKVEI